MATTKTARTIGLAAIILATVGILLVASMLSPFPQGAEAVTLQALSPGQLTEYSDTVIVARTVSSSSRLTGGQTAASGLGSVETVVQLQVVEVLKGTSATYRPLVLPGGTAGGVTMTVDYVPAFHAGETSVLFLDSQGRVVGGPQGKLDVVDDRVPALGVTLAGLRSLVKTGFTGYKAPQIVASDLSVAREMFAQTGFPIIDGITPSSASAGTNSRVTIKGSGFGAAQGSGGVSFWYGNLGHATISAPVVSWTDTSIVCVVPTATIDGYEGSAGSGPVTVTTSGGLVSNNYDFHVTFSYSGMHWANAGYTYRLNSNTADTTNEETMVDQAAATWNAASSFRFKDGGSCTTTYKAADYHCDIFWSETALPAGIAAAATVWSDASNPSVILEVDITFNDSAALPAWGDGSGGTIDVQAVAVHEMGHALGLLDLYGPNDRSKVMYGVESDFSVSPRNLSEDDAAGPAYIYGGGSGGGSGGGDEGGDEGDDSGSDSHLFSDLTPDNPYFAAITDLAGKGIITGFSDGTFRPGDSVTRQQFAKMIVRTLGLEVTGDEVSHFTDVVDQAGSDPLYPAKYVAVCAAAGITTGKTETTFAPKESITRQQLITMVVRAANLAEPSTNYLPSFGVGQFSLQEHYDNAVKAAYAGLLDGLVGVGGGYDFKLPSTRGECAQLLSTMRREQPVGGPRVIFADDFAGNEAAWPEFQWPDWRWLIDTSARQYTCSIDTTGTLVMACLADQREGCTLEVDAHCVSTVDDVSYGVAFGVSSDLKSFYGFTVSSKGSWQLWRRGNGTFGDVDVLAGKSSGVISKGRAWNRLRVTTDGTMIDLWVNGNQVYTFTKALGVSGLVGLLASSPSDAHGQENVAFDNFKIWSVRWPGAETSSNRLGL
jgi:hypothetical protein